jgi:membrane-bound lytic murein transglycosylase F
MKLNLSLITLSMVLSVFLLPLISGCEPDEKKEINEAVILKTEIPSQEFDDEIYEDHVRKIMAENKEFKRSFEAIRKEGVLRAATLSSSTSYFIYKGQPMGFEFELLQKLSEELDLELEIVVARDILELLRMLYEGEADIVAYGLTITKKRKEYADFTDPLFLSHQVLVQRKPQNWRKMMLHEIDEELITNNIELIRKTVSVRPRTSYIRRLNNLMEEIGDEIYIDTVPLDIETEELIRRVADGEIKYTVADHYIASLNASYYPELDIRVPLSFSQRVAWAVRKSSPDLKEAVNNWLRKIKQTPDFNVIYEKYFEDTRDFRKRIRDDYYSPETGKISPYDELIKKYSANIDWDWRLVSSLIYQESQFNPIAKSWAGAQGLMQLMPATAKEVGVKNTTNPEESIRGGTDYLKDMWNKWDDVPDSIQRVKFTMASFNCGYYHVKDAANLAEKYGADRYTWDDNVEAYILKLSDPKWFNDPVVYYGYVRGIEPYTYVFEIFERYDHYIQFVSK